MKRAPADVAKEIKRLERRTRQLGRCIGAVRQAIDVLREHEAFVAELSPAARHAANGRRANAHSDFTRSLGDEANDDARRAPAARDVSDAEKSFPAQGG